MAEGNKNKWLEHKRIANDYKGPDIQISQSNHAYYERGSLSITELHASSVYYTPNKAKSNRTVNGRLAALGKIKTRMIER